MATFDNLTSKFIANTYQNVVQCNFLLNGTASGPDNFLYNGMGNSIVLDSALMQFSLSTGILGAGMQIFGTATVVKGIDNTSIVGGDVYIGGGNSVSTQNGNVWIGIAPSPIYGNIFSDIVSIYGNVQMCGYPIETSLVYDAPGPGDFFGNQDITPVEYDRFIQLICTLGESAAAGSYATASVTIGSTVLKFPPQSWTVGTSGDYHLDYPDTSHAPLSFLYFILPANVKAAVDWHVHPNTGGQAMYIAISKIETRLGL